MSRSYGSPASSRRYAITSRTRPGPISSVAASRKKSVPVTASSPRLSRTSVARSSRPVASGNFLGALGAVAGAPAHVGLALDLVLELDDRVHQRLRPRRAAGDVDVDRHELVGALDDGVVVEHAGARRADAHRD